MQYSHSTAGGQRSVAERLPAEWNRRVRAGASSGHPSRYRKTKRGSEVCETHHNHYSSHIHVYFIIPTRHTLEILYVPHLSRLLSWLSPGAPRLSHLLFKARFRHSERCRARRVVFCSLQFMVALLRCHLASLSLCSSSPFCLFMHKPQGFCD